MALSKFKVIIVGGGVSGLTLANALERAQVDYVLLESKSEFAPVLGASIALGPNGNRILDQLSCCESPTRAHHFAPHQQT
jgi:2-polyprenyl-6-methoxyphenol hydroxylase-like FAD-dependent oxidoreductase